MSLLAGGSLPVRMIAGHFPSISRPAVSKHLRILREGGLVSEERSGRERYYRVELATVETTLDWIASVGARAAGAAQTITTSKAASKRVGGSGPEVPRPRKRRRPIMPKKTAQGVKDSRPSELGPGQPEATADVGVDSGDWKAW